MTGGVTGRVGYAELVVPEELLGRARWWVWVELNSVNGKRVAGCMYRAGRKAHAEPTPD